jgi:hypothetical protein
MIGSAGAGTAVRIEVGGLCVAVETCRPDIACHLRDRYGGFISNRAPHFALELAVDETEQACGPASEDCGTTRPRVARLGDRLEFRRADFTGWINWTARRGEARFPCATQVTAVESFLRIAYSFLALEQGGLLLHSAGIRRDRDAVGRGYIFPGRSGTGKSTIAGFATAREEVLSDEMVLVRPESGGYCVYSTPFYGTGERGVRDRSAHLCAGFLPLKDADVY